MARQSNGAYQQPANTSAVSGQTIGSAAYDTLITDIGTEITNSLDRQGRSAMSANLPMGANKITGMADPTVSTDAATKNYVDTNQGLFTTGDIKLTIKIVADAGWLLFNDGTFGNAGSGGTNRANVDCLNLYTLLWNNISSPYANAYCAVTGGLGASAAADWAGLKAMALPKTLGRALAIAGSGSGLTARALGQVVGEESHVLAQSELPAVTLSGTIAGSATPNQATVSVGFNAGAGGTTVVGAISNSPVFVAVTGTASVPLGGSGVAFNVMQPTTFLNAMIKL